MEKLSKKDKILIGVSIVSIGVAGYFGCKYYNSKNKILEKDIALKLAEEEKGELVEKLNFLRFLIIESGCIPKANQNCRNKIAREEGKIQRTVDALVKQPYSKTLKVSLQKHEAEAKSLMYHSEILDILKELINKDNQMYAKNTEENKLIMLYKNGIDQGKMVAKLCEGLNIAS